LSDLEACCKAEGLKMGYGGM